MRHLKKIQGANERCRACGGLIDEDRRSFALAEFVKRPQADIKLARRADYPLGTASVNPRTEGASRASASLRMAA
jgi:hypothetical protein